MSHAQVRDGSMLKLRTRLVAIYAALAFATVVAWVAAFWTFHDHQVLLYTCLLAYAFGFRHAVDADHIAAIDNVTRKLMADGRTGFLIVALVRRQLARLRRRVQVQGLRPDRGRGRLMRGHTVRTRQEGGSPSMFFLVKTLISALIIATVSTVSKRYPGFGGLIASLPLDLDPGRDLVVVGAARGRADERPSREHVLVRAAVAADVPADSGDAAARRTAFWPSLAAGCLVTIALYGVMLWLGPKAGLKL